MRIRDRIQRLGVRLGFFDRSEVINRCGIELSEPRDDLKGVFLLNGTRMSEYDLVWRHLRANYVIVLTHYWALLDYILEGYRSRSHLIDCVVSPDPETDKLLNFAPVFRSNSVDLLVDDELWPRMNLNRDITIMDSVSVPWPLKRSLRWFEETRRFLDRAGEGCAVYKIKREPGEKEDSECHREYERFRTLVDSDNRFEIKCEVDHQELVELYNRTRALYHPSSSEFGSRCVIEAMYCGAWVIVEPFAWTNGASAIPEVQKLVQIQEGLHFIPSKPLPDVRMWQTARSVRSKLMEFLQLNHRINPEIKSFTMYSHVRIDSKTLAQKAY